MHYVLLNSDTLHVSECLYPGRVSPEHFQLLITLSKIRGEKVKFALEAFLVKGESRKEIFEKYNINPGYFSNKLNQLRRCSKTILDVIPYYIYIERRKY